MEPGPLDVAAMAARLTAVDGVEAVVLGGSRARGDHLPDSDYDLGLYYRPPLDVAALARLARDVTGSPVEVTKPGGWGPWVDGGAWLEVGGVHVDWIYRELDRVRRARVDAEAGRYSFHRQPGHPLGVPDFAYVGELALGAVLADRTGTATALRDLAADYPAKLSEALVTGLWEPAFEVAAARKATARGDSVYVAAVIAHALLLCAHGIHGRARHWLINEKGAIAAAGRLDAAPPGFAARCSTLLASIGSAPEELEAALDAAERIIDDVRAACVLD